MEKYQRLFSKNNKDGVAQFWDFRQDEKRGPEAADPIVFDVTVKYEKKHLYTLDASYSLLMLPTWRCT